MPVFGLGWLGFVTWLAFLVTTGLRSCVEPAHDRHGTMNQPTAIATDLFSTARGRVEPSRRHRASVRPSPTTCDFVDVRGIHHRGAVAVGEGHQAIFDSIYAGSTVRYEVEDARCLTADIVLAVVGATLDAPTGPLQGTNHSRISAVITAGGGRWAITGFHNTLVRDG